MSLQQLLAVAQAAGAEGIWLLNGASPRIDYAAPPIDEGDEVDIRALDLQDAGRVLIICLPGPDDATDYGLTTLVAMPGYCRVCGCSQFNACETESGPCGWVEEDLCSACEGKEVVS